MEVPIDTLGFTETVAHSGAGMQRLFEEKQVGLRFQIAEGVLPAVVQGDEDWLAQAVINLLSNALKFCASPNGIVSVHLQRQGHYYRGYEWP